MPQCVHVSHAAIAVLTCCFADVLDSLRQESIATNQGDGSRPPQLEVEGECTYYSPTDDMAMEKVRSLPVAKKQGGKGRTGGRGASSRKEAWAAAPCLAPAPPPPSHVEAGEEPG